MACWMLDIDPWIVIALFYVCAWVMYRIGVCEGRKSVMPDETEECGE